jgi:UDP-GlcNAc:undecaprenyl-phosphate GlcNAc-1-phosphate transferase
MHYLLSILIAGSASSLLAWLSVEIAPRLGLLDRADRRKLHRGARSIGGLALFCGFLIGAAPFLAWSRATSGMIVGSAAIAGLGLIDDLRGLGPKTKLLAQSLAALLPMLWGGIWIGSIGLGGLELELGGWGILLTLFWLVGITNAINLLDGLDGLAAGCTAIASAFIALIAGGSANPTTLVLALALLGATLGFLRYNFYPARLFLGNEGSYSIGFILGILALEPFQPEFGHILRAPILVSILLLGLPIADTLWAIIRRARAGRSILAPDRGHIHHRLLERWGYPKALGILYGISLVLGLVAFCSRWK